MSDRFHMNRPAFGFGKSAERKIQDRVTYNATAEGRRQIEDYLVQGNTASILGVIAEREGSCTIPDIEAKTHLDRKDIMDSVTNMLSMGWITKKGSQGGYGYSMPQGYPPLRR